MKRRAAAHSAAFPSHNVGILARFGISTARWTSRPMRKNTGTPPFLNVILCSQTSNSIPATQRTLLHADQGDQACDQAQDPEREQAPENVCQIDAKCVCRR